MHSKSSIAASIAGFIAVILLLCAGSPRAAAAPPSNACSLLTQAQVSAALGVSAAGKGVVPKVCLWSETGTRPGASVKKVDLVIMDMNGCNIAKIPNNKVLVIPVSGLGDDAYNFAMASGQYMTLRFKKGSVAFSIRVHRAGAFSVDQVKAKEKTLAQEVLARL